jgi:hypothetical protein
MRKLILLALGLGAIHLLKKEADRRGTTLTEIFGDKVSNAAAWLTGREEAAPESEK